MANIKMFTGNHKRISDNENKIVLYWNIDEFIFNISFDNTQTFNVSWDFWQIICLLLWTIGNYILQSLSISKNEHKRW